MKKIEKLIKIIRSCKTQTQLDTATQFYKCLGLLPKQLRFLDKEVSVKRNLMSNLKSTNHDTKI